MGDTSLQPSIQVFATLGFIDHRLGWRLRETFWTRVSVLTDMALPALAYDHLLWLSYRGFARPENWILWNVWMALIKSSYFANQRLLASQTARRPFKFWRGLCQVFSDWERESERLVEMEKQSRMMLKQKFISSTVLKQGTWNIRLRRRNDGDREGVQSKFFFWGVRGGPIE